MQAAPFPFLVLLPNTIREPDGLVSGHQLQKKTSLIEKTLVFLVQEQRFAVVDAMGI